MTVDTISVQDSAIRREAAGQDGRFFRAVIIALTVVALAGFAPSYYLRVFNDAPPELNILMHLHGAVFTLWVVLLVVQSQLIGAGNRLLHRRLGFASIGLVVAMMAAAAGLAYERTLVWIGNPAFDYYEVLAFLATPATTIVYFSLMFGLAVYFRGQPAIHKRLMILACLDLYSPAVSRLPWIGTMSPAAHFVAIDLFIVVLLVHDWRMFRRPHVATVLGGLFLVGAQYFREWVGWTDTWLDFAIWLTS